MTFDEVLTQIIDLLKRQGRVSYSALKRRFDLDDDYLNDLKDEILLCCRCCQAPFPIFSFPYFIPLMTMHYSYK